MPKPNKNVRIVDLAIDQHRLVAVLARKAESWDVSGGLMRLKPRERS